MEYEVKVDEKGRIVIPKEIREKLNIASKVKLVVMDDEIIIKNDDKSKVLEKYAGIFNVDWTKVNKEVRDIYKEVIKERSEKWLKDILM